MILTSSGRETILASFGSPPPGVRPRLRRAVYAVVTNQMGHVLAIQGPGGCFLPGGGIEAGESEEDALHRECQEEIGVDVVVTERLGKVRQYFFAEEAWWKMDAIFFRSELLGTPLGDDFVWLPLEQLDRKMFHECHSWAVTKLCAI